ncbi:MAG: hypothetical protein KA408_07675 [Flavobacteriales bacterium]|nr:hypothetical protein [Flavobacteriales bacterium]
MEQLSKLQLQEFAKRERDLWWRYGIRIKIEKITMDGSKVLCTASRTRKSILYAYMPIHEVMELSYQALSGLNRVGCSPYISAVHKKRASEFKPLDTQDPFGLCSAISDLEQRMCNANDADPAQRMMGGSA